MSPSIAWALLCAILLFARDVQTQQALSLQLQWDPQTAYAEMIMPTNTGLYAAFNLSVAILSGGANINAATYVALGVADIGIAWLQPVLQVISEGYDLVIVAQIMQRSGQRLVSLASSGIDDLRKVAGKRVALWTAEDVSPVAALANLGLYANVDYTLIAEGSTPTGLLTNDFDVCQVMTYNEWAQLLTTINPATGLLYQPDDFNLLELDAYNATSTVMEEVLFVRRSWLADADNVDALNRFLTVIARTAIYTRDNEEASLVYMYPTSTLDYWQLHYTNELKWPDPPLYNMYGLVNETLYNITVDNMIQFDALSTQYLANYTNAWTNEYIAPVIANLKAEGYLFNVSTSTAQLTWCLSIANVVSICTGDEQYVHVELHSLGMRIFIYVVAALLLSATLGVIAITFYFRKLAPFRMTSPEYLAFMLTGPILIYVAIVTYTATVTAATCNVYIWLLSVGFTFLYGPYIAKTYRLYLIFRDKSLRAFGVNPLVCILIFMVILMLDLILLILFSTLHPPSVYNATSPINEYVQYATCRYSAGVGYTIIAYKGVVICVAATFAYLLRNVKVRHINESRPMSTAILGTAFIVIVIFLVIFLQSNPDATLAFQAIGIFAVGGLNTTLMFLEKIVGVFTKAPEELEQLYDYSDSNPSNTHSTSSSTRHAPANTGSHLSRTGSSKSGSRD